MACASFKQGTVSKARMSMPSVWATACPAQAGDYPLEFDICFESRQ